VMILLGLAPRDAVATLDAPETVLREAL
jgi:hypothetical protein